jgi:hemoglobin-like flavoprotein
MPPERIARLRRSFEEVSTRPRALASLFYQELFAESPRLRPLFPADMTSLQGHFEAALALVIRNLEDLSALQESLRELGVAHVHWGAKPEDYAFVREALIRAIHAASPDWTEQLERDWRSAITAIAVPMLQGAAVHTAVVAEQMADRLFPESDPESTAVDS